MGGSQWRMLKYMCLASSRNEDALDQHNNTRASEEKNTINGNNTTC